MEADDLDDDATRTVEVALEGEGPFELPICVESGVVVGEDLALLTLKTLDGQEILVPIAHKALVGLYQVTASALREMGAPIGETLQ